LCIFCSQGQTAVAIFHVQDGEMRAAFDQFITKTKQDTE
jgi:hypothetical protein